MSHDQEKSVLSKKTKEIQTIVEESISRSLTALGENLKREGLSRTPERYAKAMQSLLAGYNQNIEEEVNRALFTQESSEMILVRDIELYSLCEHHILPFFGKAHIAYIPNGKIVGLSKIPRIVDTFARRLQVQERLTAQISDEIMRLVKPHGVGVIIEASHMCMMMRGVQKQNSSTITSSMSGVFRTDQATRAEFMQLVNRGN